MRVYLTTTHWPNGKKADPTIGLVEGDLTLTDEDLFRLAQVLFAVLRGTSTGRPSLTIKESVTEARAFADEVKKQKLRGRQTEYNDEEREKHLSGMRVATQRENELIQALKEAIEGHEVGGATTEQYLRWLRLVETPTRPSESEES